MTLKSGLNVLVAGLFFVGFSSAADAAKRAAVRTVAVTGLAASHDMARVGGRLCFAEHTHYGSSTGQANQRAAQAAAVEAWAQFVYVEYGSEWDKFPRAAGKDMKCSQATGGWGCDLAARPCR